MNQSRIEQIVRHFRENGLKLLLENPANARELLGLTTTRLSYIQALVYHDRKEPERDGLRETILKSVQTDERRREVETMFRSGAEALREEGREEGRQEGQLIGTIILCQRLLKRPFTPATELMKLPLSELQQLARQLEQELPQ